MKRWQNLPPIIAAVHRYYPCFFREVLRQGYGIVKSYARLMDAGSGYYCASWPNIARDQKCVNTAAKAKPITKSAHR